MQKKVSIEYTYGNDSYVLNIFIEKPLNSCWFKVLNLYWPWVLVLYLVSLCFFTFGRLNSREYTCMEHVSCSNWFLFSIEKKNIKKKTLNLVSCFGTREDSESLAIWCRWSIALTAIRKSFYITRLSINLRHNPCWI